MLLFEQITRIQVLHSLIIQEKIGTLNELAASFHLSKRQLYNILDELKDLGADIKYCRIRKTFYYNNNFQINIYYEILF